MTDIKNIIADIKQEINQEKQVEKTASLNPQQEDVSLEDLGLEIQTKDQIEESITKIASHLDDVNSLDELQKIAEEAGQTDIADLIKIANTIGDKIAERVIARLESK